MPPLYTFLKDTRLSFIATLAMISNLGMPNPGFSILTHSTLVDLNK